MKLFYYNPPSKTKLKKRYFKGFENLWEQTSLPLGNGSLGMGIMGEVKSDKIVLNHKTLWVGGPSKSRPHYCGGNITTPDKDGKLPKDYYKEIYNVFKNGDNQTAHNLCEKLVGVEDGYGAYQTWGQFKMDFKGLFGSCNYYRELSLNDAVCRISYASKQGLSAEIHDERSFFVSHPHNCGVIRLTRKGGSLNMVLSLDSAHGKVEYKNNAILHKGELKDNGLKICLYAEIITDGIATNSCGGIEIKNANEAIIVFSADTDYFDNYPLYRTGETLEALTSRVTKTVKTAVGEGYDNLLSAHIEDYQKLYNRTELNLNGEKNIPADEALYQYSNGDSKICRRAEELLYAYCRYLLIASTRENDILPSNLQGIWNVTNAPEWSSDFHTNVNLQMNYWPVFNGNMAECSKPLIRYIKSMAEPGRLTAEYYTGVKSEKGETNGFMLHTQCTPFGWTCPGWEFNWGWSPAALPWILHNIFEHYEYTLDTEMLAKDIYPMLRETAEYFEKLLVEHNGRLVTYPCFSPEHGPRTMGNTYEQALVYQLYEDAVISAKALNIDADLQEKWTDIQSKLKPYEIGADGQIKEWYHEEGLGSIGEIHHRHMSHLLGLYPCNVMNKANNPELVKAAIISMNHRTDKSTGWSMGQKINTWARVGDGDRVLKIIGDLFKNGIYPNFWDYHPPFQIDGNFGFTSGVNEMLMQSHCGFIELLPALPTAWESGSIRGLVARGNFTVDIAWNNGKLTTAKIISNMGGKCKIHYQKSEFQIEGVCNSQNGFAEFETQKGEAYIIKTI